MTLAYARKHDLQYASDYVLAPGEDKEGLRAVESLRERLAPVYRDRIIWLPLERAVDRALKVAKGSFADHLQRFRRRYLDFSEIAGLISHVQRA